MKPLRDNHTRALLTSMWASLILVVVLMFINSRPLNLIVTFVVGVGLAYWMGCLRTRRPWEMWKRAMGDRYHHKLVRVKHEQEKLMETSSITKFDEADRLQAQESVLIDVLDRVAPERRLPS